MLPDERNVQFDQEKLQEGVRLERSNRKSHLDFSLACIVPSFYTIFVHNLTMIARREQFRRELQRVYARTCV